MHITVYSLLMTVIWSTLLTSVFAILKWVRKDQGVCSVVGILTLYAFSIIRLIAPLEMPWTRVIPVDIIYNPFYRFLSGEIGSVGRVTICTYHIIIIIWLAVAVFRIGVLFYRRYPAMQRYKTIPFEKDNRLDDILERVLASEKKRLNVEVVWDKHGMMPIGIGVTRRKILIPKQFFSDEELYFIIKHEYMHMKNGDLLVSSLTDLFCAVFWWNPFTYILKNDLTQIFEIRCDRMVLSGQDREKEKAYLNTLYKVYELRNGQKYYDYGSVAMLGRGDGYRIDILERFKLITEGKHKNSEWMSTTIAILLAVVLMIVSYSFVFQSRYEPDDEDFGNTKYQHEINMNNCYILRESDDRYVLVLKDNENVIIDEQEANILSKEGIKIEDGNYEKD